MKRRVLAGILASVFVLGTLAGCGEKKEEAAPAKDDTATEAPAEGEDADAGDTAVADGDLGTITLIMSQRDEFLSTLESGVLSAAEAAGVKINSVDAQIDTSKQLQFIETAKNDGQKAIIINEVDSETCPQLVEAAGDMKVVFVNRYPADPSVLNENVVYVGSDENTSGKYQGEWLAEHFKAEGKTEIKYILLNGIIGHTSTTLRTESVLKALKDNGITATEATAPLAGEYDRATAQDLIDPLLTTVEYDCIISNNDAMALGAIEAMKQKGIDPKTIPVVGIDATVDGCAAVKSGEMAMTVFQDAAGQGSGSVNAAVNLLKGNPLNEGTDYEVDETGFVLWVPFEPVTAENVDDYM